MSTFTKDSVAPARPNAEAALPELVGQISSLEDEICVLKDKIADLWASAKDSGLDVKAMRIVLKEVRDPEKLEAHIAGEMIVDRYRKILRLIGADADPDTAKLRVIAEGLKARGMNVSIGAAAPDA